MNPQIKRWMDEIEKKYNPEQDLPQGFQPQVTFAEWYLKEAVVELMAEVEKLRAEIEALKGDGCHDEKQARPTYYRRRLP